MAQWIRPQTLNREVPGSNLLAAAVVPLGKAQYLKPLVPWLFAYEQLAFLVARLNNPTIYPTLYN